MVPKIQERLHQRSQRGHESLHVTCVALSLSRTAMSFPLPVGSRGAARPIETCPREEAADLRGRMRDPGCRPFSTRAQHHHSSRPRHDLPAPEGDPQNVKLEVLEQMCSDQGRSISKTCNLSSHYVEA